MSILWGTSFPEFHLISEAIETFTFTGDGSTETFSFTLTKIPVQKNTVQITATYTSGGTVYNEIFNDGGIGNLIGSLGSLGKITYSTGTCVIDLYKIPDKGTTITFECVYYQVNYNIVFTAPDLVDMTIQWRAVKEYELLTFAKVYKQSNKWRGVFTMWIEAVNDFTSTDNLRLIYSWHNELSKRYIIMYPRPGYLKGFYVIIQGDFDLENLVEHKWIGHKIEVAFMTKNVYNEIPTHTGGVGDVAY